MLLTSESRQIVWAGRAHTYFLKRSIQRRVLSLSVGAKGLVVHAPWSLPATYIEQFIYSKQDWIDAKLALRSVLAKPTWQAGMALRFKGELLVLKWHVGVQPVCVEENRYLCVTEQGAAEVHRAVVRWYQEQAFDCYTEQMQRFLPLLACPPKQLKLSAARSRWGSCTQAGVVRINWRLVQASVEEIDYVIAHELAHLTHLNHSVRFWQEVSRLYAEFAAPRARLKKMGAAYFSPFE